MCAFCGFMTFVAFSSFRTFFIAFLSFIAFMAAAIAASCFAGRVGGFEFAKGLKDLSNVLFYVAYNVQNEHYDY